VNGSFIGVHHDTLLVQHENVHGQPTGRHPQWVVCKENPTIHIKGITGKESKSAGYLVNVGLYCSPSGIRGRGGLITVQPAFLNISIWMFKQKVQRGMSW